MTYLETSFRKNDSQRTVYVRIPIGTLEVENKYATGIRDLTLSADRLWLKNPVSNLSLDLVGHWAEKSLNQPRNN